MKKLLVLVMASLFVGAVYAQFDASDITEGQLIGIEVLQNDAPVAGQGELRAAVAIPEPATMVLLGLGSLALLRYKRR